MVHKELTVVHFGEDLDMDVGINRLQVLHLWLSHKGFFRPVPEKDIGAVDGFQFIGIDRFVTVQDGTSAAEWIYLSAFVQQYVEIVRVEHPPPESRPMITGPYVEALVVTQRPHQPFRQGQQRCGVQDGVDDDDLVALQHAGEDL